MAGSFEVHGDGTTTVTLTYTAITENVQATIEAAAHMLYSRRPLLDSEGEPLLFGDLTNQDKLDIVDRFVRWRIIELGREYLHEVRAADSVAYREADNATLMEPE